MEKSFHLTDYNNSDKQNRTVNYYEKNAYDYFLKTCNIDISNLWEKLSDQKEGSLLLDLGCGSGRDLRYFAKKKIKTIGIDISYNLLRYAYDFSKRPVVQANMISLPFNNGSFDVVWAIGTLLHIPRDYVQLALSEIHRVLKRKSIFITSVKKGDGEGLDKEGRYFTYYSNVEWENMLVKNHFTIKSLEENNEARGAETIDWIVSVSITQ